MQWMFFTDKMLCLDEIFCPLCVLIEIIYPGNDTCRPPLFTAG